MRELVSLILFIFILLFNFLFILPNPQYLGTVLGIFYDPVVILVGVILSFLYFTNFEKNKRNQETTIQLVIFTFIGFLFCHFFMNIFNTPHYKNYGYDIYMMRLNVLFIISAPFLFIRFFVVNIFKKKEEKSNIPSKEIKTNIEEKQEERLPYGKNPELKTLPFKSSYKAFEYTEKFTYPEKLNTQTAFLGVVALPSLVMIRVDDNGEAKRIYVYAENHPDLKSEVKNGDLVDVGINDIGSRLVTYDEFMSMNDGTSDKDKLSDRFLLMLQEMPKGFVLHKLKPILDLKTNQYIRDE